MITHSLLVNMIKVDKLLILANIFACYHKGRVYIAHILSILTRTL